MNNNLTIAPVRVEVYGVDLRDILNHVLVLVRKSVTVFRVYRSELKAARVLARLIDRHNVISSALLWLMGIAFAFHVFMYA